MGCGDKISGFFTYQTVKLVEIKNSKLGFLYYFIILAILGFVIGYQIIYKHSYQRPVQLIGDASVKAKGTGYLGNSTNFVVWDAVDVVIPAKEPNAIFLTTNVQSTLGQTRSKCADYSHPCINGTCHHDPDSSSDGIPTGNCTMDGYCEVNGWCPAERDVKAHHLFNFIEGVQNFSLFVRVTINFFEDNLIKSSGRGLIPHLNQFYVKDIIAQLPGNLTYDSVKQAGAVIAMLIEWKCNLDYGIDACQPHIQFARLDDPTDTFSNGSNFRYADKYYKEVDGQYVEFRDLYKVYGLRFVFMVSGQGEKFDLASLATAVGSGLALLSIAGVTIDILLLYIIPRRKVYRTVKIQEAEGLKYDPLYTSAAEADISDVEDVSRAMDPESSQRYGSIRNE